MMFLLLILILYLLISVHDICYRKIPDIFPVLITLSVWECWFSVVTGWRDLRQSGLRSAPS